MARRNPIIITQSTRFDLNEAHESLIEIAQTARGAGVTGNLEHMREFVSAAIALSRDAADAACIVLSTVKRLETEEATKRYLEKLKPSKDEK